MSLEEPTRIKVVTVGFGGVGKTSLLLTYTTGAFPEMYVPTMFENYVHEGQTSSGKPVGIGLWDPSGGEDFERLRPLEYPQTDVFILCFSVENRMRRDFKNLVSYWFKELNHFCPNVPIILVATKTDLREDENRTNTITTEEGRKMAEKVRAMYYMETSSLQQHGLTELFQRVIDVGYEHQAHTRYDKKSHDLFYKRARGWRGHPDS